MPVSCCGCFQRGTCLCKNVAPRMSHGHGALKFVLNTKSNGHLNTHRKQIQAAYQYAFSGRFISLTYSQRSCYVSPFHAEDPQNCCCRVRIKQKGKPENSNPVKVDLKIYWLQMKHVEFY